MSTYETVNRRIHITFSTGHYKNIVGNDGYCPNYHKIEKYLYKRKVKNTLTVKFA